MGFILEKERRKRGKRGVARAKFIGTGNLDRFSARRRKIPVWIICISVTKGEIWTRFQHGVKNSGLNQLDFSGEEVKLDRFWSETVGAGSENHSLHEKTVPSQLSVLGKLS